MFENNSEIIYKNENNISYIQFKKLLDLNIKHAYSLKRDDVNFRSGNPLQDSSYERLCSAIGLDVNTKTKPKQNHTSNVRCIDRVMTLDELTDVDGLITDKKNITLSTTNADCILFFVYDPVKKVIANIHSGWKGTFQKIIEKALNKMIINYKCNPADIMVFINPSIRKCHFEVDVDVKDLCDEIFSFLGNTDEFIKKGEIKNNMQKYYIDTVMINKKLLLQLGVKEENIIDCNLCSVCNSDNINSYRVEGKDFRLATAIISL